MKLASLKDGRDGQLVIVSRDLATAVDASDIAPTLQAALDEWDVVSPQLAARNEMLNACLLYTSPSPRDGLLSRMPSSA